MSWRIRYVVPFVTRTWKPNPEWEEASRLEENYFQSIARRRCNLRVLRYAGAPWSFGTWPLRPLYLLSLSLVEGWRVHAIVLEPEIERHRPFYYMAPLLLSLPSEEPLDSALARAIAERLELEMNCLLYTSPSPRDRG